MDGPLSFEEFQKCIQSGVFPGAVVPLSHVPPSSNSPAVPDGIEIVVEDDDEESSKPMESYEETFSRRPRPISLNQSNAKQIPAPQPLSSMSLVPNVPLHQNDNMLGKQPTSKVGNLPLPPSLPFPLPGPNFTQNQIWPIMDQQNFIAAPKPANLPIFHGFPERKSKSFCFFGDSHVGRLSKHLDKDCTRHSITFHFKSGLCLRDAFSFIPMLSSFDVVVIQCGGNDIAFHPRKDTKPDWPAQVSNTFKRFLDKIGPSVKVKIMPVIGRLAYPLEVRNLNARLRKRFRGCYMKLELRESFVVGVHLTNNCYAELLQETIFFLE